MIYIAEDVPWYMIDRTVEQPWRDEDVAMSAPRLVAASNDEYTARTALSEELERIAEFEYVIRDMEDTMYRDAAAFIRSGGDGVRILGRYYRIREA